MKQVREGYKMTELGEIPTGWEVKRLELLVEIKSGNSPAEFVLNEDGIYPFYKVDDMNYTEKALSTLNRIIGCILTRILPVMHSRGYCITA